jgi:hypothetical protein
MQFTYLCVHIMFKSLNIYIIISNKIRQWAVHVLFHCSITLHVSGALTPIIRSTRNCSHSHWYGHISRWVLVAACLSNEYFLSVFNFTPCNSPGYRPYQCLWLQFLVLLMMDVRAPETYRVILQWNKISTAYCCILLDIII